MRFVDSVRAGEWHTVVGYLLFVALMTAGYYYNITFVQLGLIDLGTRLVGMSRTAVSTWMAALALLTFLVAVVTGVTMDRRGWSTDLRTKLRVLLGVVVVQSALTAVAPGIRTVSVFGVWIVVASVTLGVGFPVSFGLAIDFVPVPDRGPVAAVITATTYFVANAVPLDWSIDVFSRVMLVAMGPGIVVLALLASARISVLDDLVVSDAEPLVEVPRLVEFVRVVPAADVFVVDEDRWSGLAAVRPLDHLFEALIVVRDVILRVVDTFALEKIRNSLTV